MPRECSICTSPKLLKVNKARFEEHLSFNRIADRFGLSKGSVTRHFEHTEEPSEREVSPEGPPPPGLPADLATVRHPPLPNHAPSCVVCRHPKEAEINKTLALGGSVIGLEREHGVSVEAIERHRNDCVAEYLERARVKLTAGTVLEQIDGLRAEIAEFIQTAKAADDLRAWGVAIQRAERSIALLAKVTTDLEGDEEAFLRSRFWAALCQAHDRALAPFPEAAAALRVELGQVFAS